jgi:hypothetical protein
MMMSRCEGEWWRASDQWASESVEIPSSIALQNYACGTV